MNSRLNYSFDVEYAVEYGVEEAILINHFSFWIRQNEASGKNKHDGRTWMYQTQKDIAAIYPFWSEDTVHRLINKLVEKGVIIKGNYNKTHFDKTIWYAFKNKEILTRRDFAESDPAKSRNQSHDKAEPIPDIKTNTKNHDDERSSKRDDFSTSKEISSISDIYSFSILKKKDWSNEEIEKAWKKYSEANNPISDAYKYIEKIINNARIVKTKTKEIKQCQQQQQTQNSKKSSETNNEFYSVKDMSESPLAKYARQNLPSGKSPNS